MKRLVSKSKNKKKEQRNQLLLGVFLVFLMLVGIFGYGIGNLGKSSSEKIEYGGYEFILENGIWKLVLPNINLYFTYNPEETENLSIDFSLSKNLNDYYEEKLYISSDNSESFIEIYRNLSPFVLSLQEACLEGDNCEEKDYPIKNCTNNLIILKEMEENKIYSEENCVFIEYSKEDKLRNVDRFLYRIFGIQ